MISTKTIIGALSISTLLLFSGCGAVGPKFVKFQKPQEKGGILYVYRERSLFFGAGLTYDIHITNSETLDFRAGHLANGGYIETYLPTGESEIWAKTEAIDSVTIDAKNGEVYCVKGGLGLGVGIARPSLEIVDMTKCQLEIVKTNKAK